MKQYIDKDALVAKIERLKADALQKKSQCKRSGLERIMHQISAYNKILSLLNTLEVKEEPISNEPLISSGLLTASADYAREQLANPDYPTYNDEYELLCAFEAGANWQEEQAIDKACEFIETYPHLFMGVLRSEVIEDFKNYMKGE